MNNNTNQGSIYLIPITISEDTQDLVIGPGARNLIKSLNLFAVENVRSARRYISSLKLGIEIEKLEFLVLNKNSDYQDIDPIIEQIKKGQSVGVMSESGCPGIADPGSLLVETAHQNNIKVHPLPGPSSILLALMGSGFSGQHFRFVGYLPVDRSELGKALRELEKKSNREQETQIFIETPYRNDRLVQAALTELNPNTKLCLAVDLTGKNEFLQTKTIKDWKQKPPIIGKIPAVFLIYSGNIL